MDALGGDGAVTQLAVLGATGAVGGRFVEVVAGQERASIRVLIRRWWHTARLVRFPVELRDAQIDGAAADAAGSFAAAFDGCDVAVSFVDGPDTDERLAAALIDGCLRAGVGRFVHLGCLGSFDAVANTRLDDAIDPPRPTGEVAARRWSFEQALLGAGANAGLDVAVVAASLIYGPFTDEGANRPRAQVGRGRVAVARGSGRCHLVYVDDVVEAMWSAATAAGPLHGRVFATGPAPTTWEAFFAAFEAVVGRPAVAVLPDDELAALVDLDPAEQSELRWPPRPGTGRRLVDAIDRRTIRRGTARSDRRRLVLPDAEELAARARDVEVPLDRAAAVLGWKPVVELDEGMRRTEAYLRWAEPRFVS